MSTDRSGHAVRDDGAALATARTLLGVADDVHAFELRRAYRRALRRAHPDHGGSRDLLDEVRTAYALLAPRASRPALDAPADGPGTAASRPGAPVPDGETSEPEVLPARIPNVLPNGPARLARDVYDRTARRDLALPARAPVRRVRPAPSRAVRTPFALVLERELARGA